MTYFVSWVDWPVLVSNVGSLNAVTCWVGVLKVLMVSASKLQVSSELANGTLTML